MNWIEAINFFVYGFVIGYFWYPFWELVKKIVSEASKAKKEWRRNNNEH